jgi:sugar phosphate permease
MPFLVAGIPGLALAVLAWNVREPPRGAGEYASLGLAGDSCSPGLGGSDLAAGAGDAEPQEGGADPHGTRSGRHLASGRREGRRLGEQPLSVVGPVRRLLAVPTLRVVYAADVLIALASGGLIFWMPSFLVRVHGLGVGRAGLVTGILQVAAGLAGLLAGGWLADKWTQRHPGGRMLTMGVGFVIGTPLAIVAFLAPDLGLFCVAAGLAVICYTVYFPCLAPQIHDVTAPGLRATALAVNILLGHVLGNLFSTPLIGWISDATGDLRVAMLAVPLVALLAGLVALRGARSAGPDRRRMLADLAEHLS